MRSNDQRLEMIELDGQAIVVASAEALAELRRAPDLDGPLRGGEAIRRLLLGDIDFVEEHSRFRLAFYNPGGRLDGWYPLLLFAVPGGWQRVHVEYLTCEVCGWRGATANPLASELYLGTPDYWAALDAGGSHPLAPCPRCGSRLPRYPIWAEPSPEGDAPIVLRGPYTVSRLGALRQVARALRQIADDRAGTRDGPPPPAS